MYVIDAAAMNYRQLNECIRNIVEQGETEITINNVNGHRYIASGLTGDMKIVLQGTGGNDLGAYIRGPEIRVCGNAQDCVANTMNYGSVVVDGRAGDVLGYGMSGGEVYVRGDVGSRAGIHMKGFPGRDPVMVIGGSAGDFLGEYMAGGTILVLGLDSDYSALRHCGVGIHGGVIYINARLLKGKPGDGAAFGEMNEEDVNTISLYTGKFAQHFGLDPASLALDFIKIVPEGKRPYGSMYVGV